MQDMPTIGNGGSGGGGGGGRFIGMGDRRLRLHNHQNHQPLKCPRCDSINTKFCYYNNYNLSQPRHFCKSCRRYWTKGGVLRSVPVGGGCRKNKRSKVKGGASPKDTKSHIQSSSSESSSLVVAATTTRTVTNSPSTVVEEGLAPNYMTSNTAVLYNFPDVRFSNINPSENSDFDRQPFNHSSTDAQIFSSELITLMTTSEEMMGFTMADIPTTCGRYQSEQPGENKISGNPIASSMMDELKIKNLSNEALDWGSGSGGGGGDQDLFDLTAEVDPTYWNESEWNYNDQPL